MYAVRRGNKSIIVFWREKLANPSLWITSCNFFNTLRSCLQCLVVRSSHVKLTPSSLIYNRSQKLFSRQNIWKSEDIIIMWDATSRGPGHAVTMRRYNNNVRCYLSRARSCWPTASVVYIWHDTFGMIYGTSVFPATDIATGNTYSIRVHHSIFTHFLRFFNVFFKLLLVVSVRRVDNFPIIRVHLVFLLIEFHWIFFLSFKILTNYVYCYGILIAWW